VAALLAGLSACGGSGDGGGAIPVPPVVADWCVNAVTGNDGNAGTFASPFKTITHALAAALGTQTVYVAPGLYDVANGETFPLVVPPSVTLLGDEPNRGNGPGLSDTIIRGGGSLGAPYPANLVAAVRPRTGVVIAGFWIHGDVVLAMSLHYGLVLPDPAVTLRNNTIRESPSGGAYMFNNAGGHTIVNNLVFGNGVGLTFDSGGVGSRVEFNLITENTHGVEYTAAGGDLGGGSAASFGGNTISCNTINDVRAAIGVPVAAQNRRSWS
jgi:hypothetical protein